MKRIQLFEFEDLDWFPDWIRTCMTRMITVVHRWLGTSGNVTGLLVAVIGETGRRQVVDLCSGDGGLMSDVFARLRTEHGIDDVSITLTDLYPNLTAAERINGSGGDWLRYATEPVDARTPRPIAGPCIRTMVSSFHHMPPLVAREILRGAVLAGDPILIYEISDNSSPPKYMWWIGLPLNFLLGLVVAAFTRPMTARQFVFSFVVPIVPLCFAWDGAISNARTYTVRDLEELVAGVGDAEYAWKIGTVKGKPSDQVFLMGMPAAASQ